MQLRYDYAVFSDDDRYLHNAMLTRQEAARLERDGMRCLDIEATMDPTLPRFRGRRYVGQRGRRQRRWG